MVHHQNAQCSNRWVGVWCCVGGHWAWWVSMWCCVGGHWARWTSRRTGGKNSSDAHGGGRVFEGRAPAEEQVPRQEMVPALSSGALVPGLSSGAMAESFSSTCSLCCVIHVRVYGRLWKFSSRVPGSVFRARQGNSPRPLLRNWSMSVPNDVSRCQLLFPDESEWWLAAAAAFCRRRQCRLTDNIRHLMHATVTVVNNVL